MKLYVARDKGGSLYLYRTKPIKEATFWDSSCDSIELDWDSFPEVKWEDTEPTEVELTIKNNEVRQR